jgi:uncharacterized membrane protein YgcG
MGSTDQHYTAFLDPQTGEVHYRTTRPLGSGEGLTIVAKFPKGYIPEPTVSQKWEAFLKSNKIILVSVVGLGLLLAYYLTAWILVGQDPERGTIVISYEPPLNLSPAGIRYLWRMRYDNRCLTVALLSMAVKGALEIREENGVFTLQAKDRTAPSLSAGEKRIARFLLKNRPLQLKNSNHALIKKAARSLGRFLQAEHEGKHFHLNRKWLIPGAILSILTVLAAVLFGAAETMPIALFMLVWLSFWSIGVYSLGRVVWSTWRSALFGAGRTGVRAARWGGALFITVFSVPFFAGEIVGLGFLAFATSILMVPLVLLLAAVNYLFWRWIKQPTGPGQRMMDQIEGFRRFLAAVEGDRLRVLTAPDRTPQLFEKYLPYALALGVENEWAEQFTEVVSKVAAGEKRTAYSPAWFRGTSLDTVDLTAFSSGLGASLSSAVSSASHAPGSRSGSSGGGGGGSSGGGGGGGGGGGW